jgi:hypothetical protein
MVELTGVHFAGHLFALEDSRSMQLLVSIGNFLQRQRGSGTSLR